MHTPDVLNTLFEHPYMCMSSNRTVVDDDFVHVACSAVFECGHCFGIFKSASEKKEHDIEKHMSELILSCMDAASVSLNPTVSKAEEEP